METIATHYIPQHPDPRRNRAQPAPRNGKIRAYPVDARALMTIPAWGLITAMDVTAVIGDITRFPRPTQLVGYLGLDPHVRQSGARRAHTGHISRQGQVHARALLVGAAHSAIRTALRREGRWVASRASLARQARSAACKRGARARSAAAQKAGRTKGPRIRAIAARKAAYTRARRKG